MLYPIIMNYTIDLVFTLLGDRCIMFYWTGVAIQLYLIVHRKKRYVSFRHAVACEIFLLSLVKLRILYTQLQVRSDF